MKKKILFILPKFEFGGTAFSTLNMISILKDSYDISVLPMVSVGPVRETYKGVTILPAVLSVEGIFIRKDEIYDHSFLYKSIKALNHLCILFHISLNRIFYRMAARKLQAKYGFDFVASCQEGDSTEFVSYFKNAKKIAWFRSEYSIYRTRRNQDYENNLKEIYSRMNAIVCVSKTTRDDFVKWFPMTDCYAFAIHNIQNVKNIQDKSETPIDDRFSPDVFNIVTVGRFSPQKRFASIPQIAHKLLEAGCKFKWYIIGDGNIEGEYDKLIKEQTKYKTNDIVIPLGCRLNPYPYIACADLFVITSSYEACPRVVAEAQILHTPVISADYSSAPEFVNDNTNGIVTTIENIHNPIIDYIKNSDLFENIKKRCCKYESDNDTILLQLKQLFS